MTDEQAIAMLDAMTYKNDDPESAHGLADEILLKVVSEEVAAAYEACRKRIGFWYA